MSVKKHAKLKNLAKLALATSIGFVFTSASANDHIVGLAASGGADASEVYFLKSLYEYANLDPVANAELLNLLNSVSTSEEAADLARSLTPDRSGAAIYSVMASQSAFSNTLRKRATDFILGDYGNTSMWVSVLGTDSTQFVTNDGQNRFDGYDSNSQGVAFGYDLMRSSDSIVGIAFSHQKTDVENRLSDRTLDIASYYAAAHGLFKFDDIYLAAQGIVGWSDYVGKRHVVGGSNYTGPTAADATYGGDNYGLNADLYYPLYVGSFTVIPSVYTDYQLVRVDGYQEVQVIDSKGNLVGGSAAALKYEKQEHEALHVGVGIEVANSLTTDVGIFSAQAKFKTKKEILDHTVSTKVNLISGGPSMTLPIAQLDDTFYETNIDLTWETASNFSFNLGAQYSWSDSQETTMFYGRGAYSF